MGHAVAANGYNGDFESVTGSTFDNWTTNGPSSYTVATSPMNIDGTNSARVLGPGTNAGMLKQQFDVNGLSDFQIDFDFAFLASGTPNTREFALLTYAGTTVVDSLGMWSSAAGTARIIQYWGTTATNPVRAQLYSTNPWMFGTETPNINVVKTFDGETPAVNHLTMVGTGYGTENYSLEITIDAPGSPGYVGPRVWTLTDHLRASNHAINTIAFYGAGSSGDFIVDNVEVNDTSSLGLNGDFEAVAAGKFLGWQTTSSNPTYNVATTPMNIGGTNSCQMLHGNTEGTVGGMLKRQFDSEGLSDFRIELDLASLVSVTTPNDDRTFCLMTQDSAGNIMDNISLIGSEGQLQIWTADLAWEKTGAFIDPTIDTGVDDSFDGETPVVNHLVLEGRGYGTEDYSMTLTLTGDYTYTYTYTGHLGGVGNAHNAAPTTIALYGGGCDSDFIVDNITVEAIEPPLIPGDADGDGDVDADDAAALAANWLTSSGATWAMGDFNGDFAVNDLDATLLAANWTGAGGASVPEPNSLVLLLIGTVMCLVLQQRSRV